MGCLETLTDENYEEFLEEGTRVLVLTQKDCPHCRAWTDEVTKFLESDEEWKEVRFARIDLASEKVEEFKKANDWLEFVPGVPFNVIFLGGEPTNSFAGSGVKRMVNRLQRLSS
jgi:hypothetical protein